MNNLNEITENIHGNIIKSYIYQKSQSNSNIIYREGFNDTYKIIRFSTKVLESVFKPYKTKVGRWKNGLKAMYEIKHSDGVLLFKCILDDKEYIKFIDNGHALLDIKISYTKEQLNNTLDSIFLNEFHKFENELIKLKTNNIKINNEKSDELLIEGNMVELLSNKYERNSEARKQCIEHYGSVCQICGFDFGKIYGKEFDGKIHVHHILPLNQIKHDYIVDPVKDLIPVCPNCHTALHSKKDGVYTPEEIKNILNKNKF